MTSSVSFEQRFAAALRRRLFPHTALRVKQMAYELGYSEDTVQRWLRGDHRVYAGAAEDVDRYFSRYHGDSQFLREVLDLARVDPGPRVDDLCLWITEGAVHQAPAGHALFARSALGLSAGIEQDVVRYAVANLGWIACLARADRRLEIRFSPKTLDPQAARRLRDWLLTDGRTIAEVRAIGLGSAGWSEATIFSVSEAVRFLDRWAVRVTLRQTLGEANWTVQREHLDSEGQAEFRTFLTALAPAEDPMAACVRAGRMGTSSLLWIKGESDVVSLYIGTDLGLPIDRFAYRNVLDRDDPRYAALVYQHMTECVKEGPTFYHLEIDIAGRRRRYRRMALPFNAGDRQMVMTTVQLLESEPT
jgi:hypothetical protein